MNNNIFNSLFPHVLAAATIHFYVTRFSLHFELKSVTDTLGSYHGKLVSCIYLCMNEC